MGILLLTLATAVLCSFGCYKIAIRRGINNAWLSFLPFGQQFILGSIADSIYNYKEKQGYFRFIFTGLLMLPLISLFIPDNDDIHAFFSLLLILFYSIYMLVNKVILFIIYKDYSPKNAWIFLISSIFIGPILDYIFLLCIKKSVPSSMCFRPQDEWQFQANSYQLQILWEQYHTQPQLESWSDFLIREFVPIKYS